MEIRNISSLAELKSISEKGGRSFLLLVKGGTENSDCALEVVKKIKDSISGHIIFMVADVNTVRDIHPLYGIESVPSLLEFGTGMLKNVYKGCNTEDFFRSVISGTYAGAGTKEEKKQRNITVYSTPSCSWCNTLKTYLKERNVRFRDIDVSADQKAAEQMVNKSGQQGVPQTDIDGHIIIGFDKKKIEDLLGSVN